MAPMSEEKYRKWMQRCKELGYTPYELDMEDYEHPLRSIRAFIRLNKRLFMSFVNYFIGMDDNKDLEYKLGNVPRIPKLDEEKSEVLDNEESSSSQEDRKEDDAGTQVK